VEDVVKCEVIQGFVIERCFLLIEEGDLISGSGERCLGTCSIRVGSNGSSDCQCGVLRENILEEGVVT
jgi:hypothetical protein